jgi:hypothetical protein
VPKKIQLKGEVFLILRNGQSTQSKGNNNRVGGLGSVPPPPFLTLISKLLPLGGPRGRRLEVKVKNVMGGSCAPHTEQCSNFSVTSSQKKKRNGKAFAANVTFCTNTTFSSYSLKESWI